jgi:hypothetical protein
MTDEQIRQAAREICAQQAFKGNGNEHVHYMSGKYDHTIWMRLVEQGIRKGLEEQMLQAVVDAVLRDQSK